MSIHKSPLIDFASLSIRPISDGKQDEQKKYFVPFKIRNDEVEISDEVQKQKFTDRDDKNFQSRSNNNDNNNDDGYDKNSRLSQIMDNTIDNLDIGGAISVDDAMKLMQEIKGRVNDQVVPIADDAQRKIDDTCKKDHVDNSEKVDHFENDDTMNNHRFENKITKEDIAEKELKIQRDILLALNDISNKLGIIDQRYDSSLLTMQNQCIELAYEIAKRIITTSIGRLAIDEVMDFLRQQFHLIHTESEINIHVNTENLDQLRERISQYINDNHYRFNVIITSGDDVEVGDCRIKWNGGSVIQNKSVLLKQIEFILQNHISNIIDKEDDVDKKDSVNDKKE